MAFEPCPHRDEHGQIQSDIEGLRRDEDRHEKSIDELYGLARSSAAGIAETNAGIARIEGSLEGALKAKKVSGTILGVAVSLVIALAGATGVLLLELIKSKGG
jgi:hypothetical protein